MNTPATPQPYSSILPPTAETPSAASQSTPPAVVARRQRFQSDNEGVFRIVTQKIYKQPQEVVIREYLQNCLDAHAARRALDPQFRGRITVELHRQAGGQATLTFADEGIGLAPDEVDATFGTIAGTSKRNCVDMEGRRLFIGQYGIGSLSALSIAASVVVLSKKYGSNAPPVRWTGYRDGFYEVAPVSQKLEAGTHVTMHLDDEAAVELTPARLVELTARFAEYLPEQIFVRTGGSERCITKQPPWESSHTENELIEIGRTHFNTRFAGAFPVQCPELGAKGIIFVTGHAAVPGAEALHRLYATRMFVSDDVRGLAPVSAPYLRGLFNSDLLELNAAREGLHNEEGRLPLLRDAVQKAWLAYLQNLSATKQDLLAAIVATHHECLLNEAEATGEHLPILRKVLPLRTTLGHFTADQALSRFGEITYATDETDYTRVELKAIQEGVCVAQGYFKDSAQLLRLLQRQLGAPIVMPLRVAEFMTRFRTEETLLNAVQLRFVAVAQKELAQEHCAVSFEEADDSFSGATLCLEDSESILRHLDFRSRDNADSPEVGTKRLLINQGHAVVQQLTSTPDLPDSLIAAWVRLFYHEALLAARERPTGGEMRRHCRAQTALWKAGAEINL